MSNSKTSNSSNNSNNNSSNSNRSAAATSRCRTYLLSATVFSQAAVALRFMMITWSGLMSKNSGTSCRNEKRTGGLGGVAGLAHLAAFC